LNVRPPWPGDRREQELLVKSYLNYLLKRAIFFKGTVWGFPTHPSSQDYAIVLQYHSISPRQSPLASYVNRSLSIEPDVFDRQMEFITRHYRVATIDEVFQGLLKRDHDRRVTVAITFDDGYRDNYLYAYPILKKYNLPATFYLTVDCIENRAPLWTALLTSLVAKSRTNHLEVPSLGRIYPTRTEKNRVESVKDIKHLILPMSRKQREQTISEIRVASKAAPQKGEDELMLSMEEVKEMSRNGMVFGSHTLSHPSLPYVPREEAWIEISKSRQILEKELGERVVHFSYPNPGNKINLNSDIKQMVKEAGYVSAATSINGYVECGGDPFELRRKGIYRKLSSLPDFNFWIEKEGIVKCIEKYGLTPAKVSKPMAVSKSL
jgi:peptidoglycan/xylan/chitin deacetylase (PgdA/CDA1 family)